MGATYKVGDVVAAPAEPPVGTIVTDTTGEEWENEDGCWIPNTPGPEELSWSYLLAEFGPVTIYELPPDGA